MRRRRYCKYLRGRRNNTVIVGVLPDNTVFPKAKWSPFGDVKVIGAPSKVLFSVVKLSTLTDRLVSLKIFVCCVIFACL